MAAYFLHRTKDKNQTNHLFWDPPRKLVLLCPREQVVYLSFYATNYNVPLHKVPNSLEHNYHIYHWDVDIELVHTL